MASSWLNNSLEYQMKQAQHQAPTKPVTKASTRGNSSIAHKPQGLAARAVATIIKNTPPPKTLTQTSRPSVRTK